MNTITFSSLCISNLVLVFAALLRKNGYLQMKSLKTPVSQSFQVYHSSILWIFVCATSGTRAGPLFPSTFLSSQYYIGIEACQNREKTASENRLLHFIGKTVYCIEFVYACINCSFIFNLAVADSLLLLTNLPTTIYEFLKKIDTYNYTYCEYTSVLNITTMLCALHSAGAVSFNRLVAADLTRRIYV